MVDVAVLFLRECATFLRTLAAARASSEDARATRLGLDGRKFMRCCSCRCPHRQMVAVIDLNRQGGSVNRPDLVIFRPSFQNSAARDGGSYNARAKNFLRAFVIALAIVDLTSCETTSTHQFAQPVSNWQTRSGQLLYRNANTTLIGEVLVRISRNGDFELTFSKGPGVTLFTLRQDQTFAEVRGAMAGPGWAGPIDHAPPQLRGWLGLRDQLLHTLAPASPSKGGQHRQSLRYVASSETFLFRF